MRAWQWLAGKKWRVYFGLAVVAAAVQCAFVLESSRSPVFQVPVVDAASYHAQAMALASDQVSPRRAFWQPPLYPYLLGELYRTGVTDLLKVRLLHGLLGVAAALLTCAICSRLGGIGTGLAAGLCICFYGPLLFFFSQLLPAGCAVVLNLCGLWLLLRFAENPGWGRAFALGLVAGIGAIGVVNSAVLPLLAFGWLIWTARKNHMFGGAVPAGEDSSPRLTALFLATAVAAGFIAGIAPVAIRNAAVSGEFVPISTNGGINLYIGNNPHTEQTLRVRPGLDWGRLVALPYRQGAKTDTEAERYFLREVANFALQHPTEFVRGLVKKSWYALGSREIPRNEDLYAFAGHSSILRMTVWRIGSFGFPFGLIGPLAAVGVFLVAWRDRVGRFVLAFAVAYAGSVVCFFPSSRYLAPAMPAVVILAVMGVRRLLGWPMLSSTGRLLSGGVLVLAGIAINLPRVLPTDSVRYDAELHTYTGVGFQTRGRLDEATGEYRKAIALDAESADAHRFLGTIYRAKGSPLLAAKEFENALVLRPDHDGALQDLAVVRYQQGRFSESVELLRTALDINPEDRQAMVNLGVGLQRMNRKEEASVWFRKAGVAESGGIVSPPRPAARR